ncbi:MAG: hypothetical protein E6447_19060, partial [Bradyrhizobium sp.]|nr:hypothetical protein [Bradyrhizobium sp.]
RAGLIFRNLRGSAPIGAESGQIVDSKMVIVRQTPWMTAMQHADAANRHTKPRASEVIATFGCSQN